MNKIQLKLEFNSEKMKAIKVSLKEKNKDFDTEILKFLNGLYNKNVPKALKNYIEMDIEPKDKTNEIEEVKEPKYNNSLENNNYKR